jgi:hypothetical protein
VVNGFNALFGEDFGMGQIIHQRLDAVHLPTILPSVMAASFPMAQTPFLMTHTLYPSRSSANFGGMKT